MEGNLIFTAKDILEKQFEKDVKGYNSEEVDDFLDTIIKDYKLFNQFQTECQEYISTLEVNIKKLKEQNRELEIKNSQLASKVALIKEGTTVSSDNLIYIDRIKKLESALYSIGKDPKAIH